MDYTLRRKDYSASAQPAASKQAEMDGWVCNMYNDRCGCVNTAVSVFGRRGGAKHVCGIWDGSNLSISFGV